MKGPVEWKRGGGVRNRGHLVSSVLTAGNGRRCCRSRCSSVLKSEFVSDLKRRYPQFHYKEEALVWERRNHRLRRRRRRRRRRRGRSSLSVSTLSLLCVSVTVVHSLPNTNSVVLTRLVLVIGAFAPRFARHRHPRCGRHGHRLNLSFCLQVPLPTVRFKELIKNPQESPSEFLSLSLSLSLSFELDLALINIKAGMIHLDVKCLCSTVDRFQVVLPALEGDDGQESQDSRISRFPLLLAWDFHCSLKTWW